ncbi:hypothetical protein D3C76_759110 [compost metagenome]
MWVKGSQKAECGLFGLRGLISETFVSDASGIISNDGDGDGDGDGDAARIAQVQPFAISH